MGIIIPTTPIKFNVNKLFGYMHRSSARDLKKSRRILRDGELSLRKIYCKDSDAMVFYKILSAMSDSTRSRHYKNKNTFKKNDKPLYRWTVLLKTRTGKREALNLESIKINTKKEVRKYINSIKLSKEALKKYGGVPKIKAIYKLYNR